MTYQAGRAAPSRTITWLRDNPAVAELARASAAVAGKALPDAVLEDPSRLVDVVKTAVVEAIRSDAPAGVAEELVPVLRFVSLGAKGFDPEGGVGRELSALQGLRDASELSAALSRRSGEGLDAATTRSIERWMQIAERQPSSDELFTLGPDDTSPLTSPFVVDPGGRPTGPTVDTTVPETTEPRTGEPDPGTGTGGAVDAASMAAELGAVIGTYLGGASGAEQGAQVGAQVASGGLTAAELGQQIGQAIGGPEGAQIGAQIGAHIGGRGDLIQRLHTWIDAAACLLCGPLCLPCVLAADALTDVVVQLVQEAIQ